MPSHLGWCCSIVCMAVNTASTCIGSIAGFSAACLSGYAPGERASGWLDLDREEQSARDVQRSRVAPSRDGSSPQGMPWGALTRVLGAIWSEPALCRGVTVCLFDTVPLTEYH